MRVLVGVGERVREGDFEGVPERDIEIVVVRLGVPERVPLTDGVRLGVPDREAVIVEL